MEKSKGGIGVTSILFLIFLTLKLTNNIDWSWWWVTSPIWIPVCIVLIVFLFAFLFFFGWAVILLSRGVDADTIREKFKNIADIKNEKPQQ
jgi:hypothetical protein